ncbi:MAG: GNAT family N-acetyltransferase [Candidatus Omnitrophica bacterium]|nr:GNAT family N-acetyltransferase [Candidatus Omnitrophota bacterium]
MLLDHAFNRLNLHRVRLGVVDQNKPALKTYTKMGFRIEGKAREQFFVDGKFRDVILMGILDREFRKLYSPKGMKNK